MSNEIANPAAANKVQLSLRPLHSIVIINGVALNCRAIRVEQSWDSLPLVTIQFHADVEAEIDRAQLFAEVAPQDEENEPQMNADECG